MPREKPKAIHEQYFDLCRANITSERDILFLQVGSFFESYFYNNIGSARTVARELNIILTRKNSKKEPSEKNPYQAGIPFASIERHINLLNDNNFNVYVYTQDDDNPKSRRFKGKYTNNIRFTSYDKDVVETTKENKVFSLILEKYHLTRKKGEREEEYKASYALCELNTGKISFAELVDSNYISLIEQVLIQNNPKDIMVWTNKNFTSNQIGDIHDILSSSQPNINFKMKEYNIHNKPIEQMLEIIDKSCGQNSKIPSDLHYYPEMIFNVFSILEYIREHDPIQVENLSLDDPWIFQESKNMRYNKDLYKELFIFTLEEEERSREKSTRSIFDMFTNSTGMNRLGRRMLAKYLHSPLTNVDQINHRYDELDSQKIPSQFYTNIIDVDQYLLKWKRNLLSERLFAKLILQYKELSTQYPKLNVLIEFIECHFNLDNMQESNIEYIKNPSNEYLMWLNAFHDELNVLNNHGTHSSSSLNLSFHLDSANIENSSYSITTTKWNQMSNDLKRKYRMISNKTTVKHVMYTEYDDRLFLLSDLNEKLKEYRKTYFETISTQVLEKYHAFLHSFHQQLGKDSMNSALKSFFQENHYSRPIIRNTNDNKGFFQMKSIRHPLIEYLHRNDEVYVPFHASSTDTQNGEIIYGMNGSGKSSYMKAVALNVWLAQCGFYCPNEELIFYPYKNMYSKLSRSDNIFKKQSLFYSEMIDLKYIMERSTNSSLIFLDELFSGTEVHSCTALLLSVIKQLSLKKIHFILTTHIHLLSDIVKETMGSRIKIRHFQMKDVNLIEHTSLVSSDANIFYNRVLVDGGSGPSLYGIEVAKQFLNEKIIKDAFDYRKHIEFKYNFKVTNKFSRYNKTILMESCSICGSRTNLETHHIVQQHHFNKDDNNINILKNMKQNLIVLCRSCHRSVESSSS